MTHSTHGFELITVVDDKRKRADTKALDISLNELADMYGSTELAIRPEYQRLFRWSEEKQSQFVESLILEMPIPPIFVIELEEGKWELIDGLQRISTYLHFRGMLSAPEHEPPISKGQFLRLAGCDILHELNNLDYNDLPLALQIRLKRSFLTVELIRKDTDLRFRYYMFKRLNTGGEQLSPQEVRNCTIRLLGDKFNNFIQRLSRDSAFQACIAPLPLPRRQKMGDVELVLRFFAFKNGFEAFRKDIEPFMTTFMERVTDEGAEDSIGFDYRKEEEIFSRVFGLLSSTLGSDTCKRWLDESSDRLGGGFSNHHFEAFSLGVAKVIDGLEACRPKDIKASLLEVKRDAAFQELTKGGGKNSPSQYRAKIDFVAERLRSLS